jgi:hypothetical protein
MVHERLGPRGRAGGGAVELGIYLGIKRIDGNGVVPGSEISLLLRNL